MQFGGLTAMRNIALNTDLHFLLVGLDVLCNEAIESHKSSSQICEAALSTLANLYAAVCCQPTTSRLEARVKLTLEVMRAHRNCPCVCCAAIAILVNLSWSDSNRKSIMALGCILEVVDAMRRFQVQLLSIGFLLTATEFAVLGWLFLFGLLIPRRLDIPALPPQTKRCLSSRSHFALVFPFAFRLSFHLCCRPT